MVDREKAAVDSRDEGKSVSESWSIYWKERSVIRKEDGADGRASVTKDEERVTRGG